MVLVYLSIPIMLVAVAIALGPLLWAMKQEQSLHKAARPVAVTGSRHSVGREPLDAGPQGSDRHRPCCLTS